ncbi:uncharacterized protein LOC122926134 [Bufo gargarizans]|uniref:uncharacterized protein LOC122926134 n=1 Tax=Bufo gargarizans TaxID=30331 RepID=UPI001CF5F259|nr:uncharacterized protein LOC122926134 [Bufo gargarizans]
MCKYHILWYSKLNYLISFVCFFWFKVSAVSTREDREFVIPSSDNELLIQLVEARPALWDPSDHKHADHHLNQRLFTGWEDLSAADKKECVDKVITRWRSIRDRFKREYNREVHAPSGSGARPKKPYAHNAALGFLRPTLGLRRTASSTREPEPSLEAAPESAATTSPPVPHSPVQVNPGPLPGPSFQRTLSTCRQNVRATLNSRRFGRSRRENYGDLVEIVSNALEGFAEEMRQVLDDLARRVEGAESARQLTENEHYLQTFVSRMDQMNPEQVHEFRNLMENGSWEILHRPPPTTYPPPTIYPPTHAYQHGHHQATHFQHPSLSQPPEHGPTLSIKTRVRHSAHPHSVSSKVAKFLGISHGFC